VRDPESRIFLGPVKSPIAIIKRGEIESFLSEDIWGYYENWRVFNSGLGLPYGPGTAQYPDMFVQVIAAFEGEWRGVTQWHS